MFTALGIANGILFHTLAAGLGLSALLMVSARLFEVANFIGVVYLIYLGVNSLWNRQRKKELQVDEQIDAKKLSLLCLFSPYYRVVRILHSVDEADKKLVN